MNDTHKKRRYNKSRRNRNIISKSITSKRKSCTILKKIVYKKNVFPSTLFRDIQAACLLLKPLLKPDKSAAKNRTHVIIDDPETIVFQAFTSPTFIKQIEGFWGTGVRLKPHSFLPIEYRQYGLNASMPWHRDQVITKGSCPQIEIVFTVTNSSNSQTEWIEDTTHKKHVVKSQPNSIMMTQGSSVFHQVTPITEGERSIIKIAFEIK